MVISTGGEGTTTKKNPLENKKKKEMWKYCLKIKITILGKVVFQFTCNTILQNFGRENGFSVGL